MLFNSDHAVRSGSYNEIRNPTTEESGHETILPIFNWFSHASFQETSAATRVKKTEGCLQIEAFRPHSHLDHGLETATA